MLDGRLFDEALIMIHIACNIKCIHLELFNMHIGPSCLFITYRMPLLGLFILPYLLIPVSATIEYILFGSTGGE